ncbi:hypothetical protein BJV77DRAFT_176700 [Russula vinacea]|nr:hypothetical protein BJV77DRAFT_176700 [Russula vinacea]
MFGCFLAGRLLQTNLQQIDETKAAFELPAAETINHISVFLLGTVPFPDGYGATVHFFWPGKGFQLLGFQMKNPRRSFDCVVISCPNPRPLKRRSRTRRNPQLAQACDGRAGYFNRAAPANIRASQCSTFWGPSDGAILAEIVKHLFNYISGFVSGSSGTSLSPDSMDPMSLIARWYESFWSKAGPMTLARLKWQCPLTLSLSA